MHPRRTYTIRAFLYLSLLYDDGLLSRVLHLTALVLAGWSASASPPADYYQTAEGKTGATLRQALHAIIHDHTVVIYDSPNRPDSVEALKVLDEDPANTNNVILVYSGWSMAKTNYGADGWNREHLWPNSYGFDIDVTTTWPALRDLFNLRACDSHVNEARGNKYYDVSDPTDANFKSSAHPSAPLCSTDTNSWEPPDAMKGDLARVMFYMAVRYEGDADKEQDLKLTDRLGLISSSTNYMGRLSTLLSWHLLDPVDDRERLRNDRIYALYQHNRNPFVDHPEWVVPAFHPALAIRLAESGVRLSWDVECPDFTLEATTDLLLPWQALSIGPVLDPQNDWEISLPSSFPARFFRLRLR